MCKKILLLAYACAALGIGRCLCCMLCGRTFRPPFDITTFLSLTSGVLLYDIYRLHPTPSHTFKTLIMQYAFHKVFFFVGNILQFSFNRHSKNCRIHQEKLLKRIIKQNKNTICANNLKINTIETLLDFVTKVPLTSYKDYEDLANEVDTYGRENVFFPGKANYLAITSGTSCGTSKIFPKNLKLVLKRSAPFMFLHQKCLLQVQRSNLLRKWLVVRAYPRFFYSKSGIKSGPISGIAADFSLEFYVTPKRGGKTSNETDIIYINLVFGLLEDKIGTLYFPTASLALTFFKTLEREWKRLCDDIQKGSISNHVNIPNDLRDIFNQHLNGGNPGRATQLRQEFQQGFDSIVPRIWHWCPALICMSTGAFQTQAKVLKEKYLGPVRIISHFHAATEGLYGFNFDLKFDDCFYVALTNLNFFEFIQEEDTERDNPKTVLADQVEIGRVYEMVVTTWDGLYRYRTEDLVEIVGFYGTIPKYKFIRRRGDILSTGLEKVPEILVHSAICTAAERWGDKPILDFTSVENIHVEKVQGICSGSRFYVVFLELEQEEEMALHEKEMVDEELVKLHDIYSNFRRNGGIQPVKLIQVQKGAFDKVKDMILRTNPTSSSLQYKLPRVMRRDDVLTFLLSASVGDSDSD